MNSKKRVLAAINHIEPDRVPLAFAATPEVITVLKARMRVDDENLLKILGSDFRNVEPLPKIKTYGDFFGDPLVEDLGDGQFRDAWGIIFRRVNYGAGTYIEYTRSPLTSVTNLSELRSYPWPKVHDIWDFSHIKAHAEAYRDYAVVFDGAVLFQFCQALRGLGQLMEDLGCQPLLAQGILEHVVEYWIEFGRALLEEAGGAVDIFTINDDYGMQQGPLFNPSTWRKYLKPLIQQAIQEYKRFGVKIAFHSCGGIRAFIPDLIEIGIDILDPVQVSAKRMEPIELKREFGHQICFRGAIDTQHVLPYGTIEEVRTEVKKRIKELAPGGGYIATSVHNIQPDVPMENILALYKTALEYGGYPIAGIES